MKKKTIVIIIILTSFLISLSISLTNRISGDGCWHMAASKFIAKNNKIPSFEYIGRTEPFWSAPLFHITNGILYKLDHLIGLDGFFIRFTLPIASLFCLIFLYLITKKLYNKHIAVYSTFFLAFMPIFLDYSSNYHIAVFLTCFILGSIYFILKDKMMLAGLFFGLAMLSKFNGIFAGFGLLYLLYMKYKRNLRKYIIFIGASLIGMLSFLRNYLLYGNPVWPNLRSILGGISHPGLDYIYTSGLHISNLLNIKVITAQFLSLYGIPGGNLRNLSFLNIPFISVLLAGFVILGIVYLIPVIPAFKGITKKNKKEIFLLVWILGFMPFNILFILNIGGPDTRLLLPIIPAFAILWGKGMDYIIKKFKIRRKQLITSILLIIIASSFSGAIIVKSVIASNQWSIYDEDYKWISNNTPKDALFIYNGQCLAINTGRSSRYLPFDNNYKTIQEGYFFFNGNFNIEPQVTLNREQQEKIKQATNCTIIYNNQKTGTSICRI